MRKQPAAHGCISFLPPDHTYMELSRFSDYALRVLMYAAAREGEKITLSELTQAYRISHHHLVKIVHYLGKTGYLHNRRGRSGGIRLGKKPSEITVGEVIRKTETHMNLVECFDPASDMCKLSPTCRLKGVFHEARDAFLDVLDHYTIADLVQSRAPILRLLSLNGVHPPAQAAMAQ
jgi:Rrf2 family transcriptional regulator, nitric oxide-sensitive transcriptional repressor